MARLTWTSVTNATRLFLRDRSTAYKLAIQSPAGQMMFRDLLKYTHFLEGPADPDNNQTWRLIGRQDVIRRMQQHAHLTDAQLFALYNGSGFQSIEEKDEDNGG